MEKDIGKEIEEVAFSLFQEFGVENVSMHKIAKTAGVGQGTLYRRYANKSDLCLSILGERFEQLIPALHLYLNKISDQPVQDRLQYVLEEIHLIVGHHLDWIRMLTISGNLEQTSKVYDCHYSQSLKQIIRDLLEEAKIKGEANIQDIELTTLCMSSPMTPELMFYIHESGYSIEKIAQFAAERQVLSVFS
ncbi:TetR/AcrR family transcriptional regulator [Bacillus altitudinis]|uniref:TetR/AcrR family transcriptional regulator n=1 Tax=Bacillus altitudinis TaxID=293387 RepID=UPI0022AF543A|nr:TetR/AcrR family transcriptional regulator [Bacillus altitudinis]MDR7670619.1 TetR/AcrR family transcriptional regulator [Bacillus altitudinis]